MQYVGMPQNHRNSKMAAYRSQMQDLILIQHTYITRMTLWYLQNKNISNITFTHGATYIYINNSNEILK